MATPTLDFPKRPTALLQEIATLADTTRIVGIACCPQVKAWIDRQRPSLDDTPWGGIRFIIDPRLAVDQSEIYSDRVLFSRRLARQNEWDRENRHQRK